MSQTLSSDVEALEDLLARPGWTLFVEYVRREWGAGGQRFEQRLDQLADSVSDDAHTLMHIRQIAVARREILRLLEWPSEEVARIRKLKEHNAPDRALNLSRRGGL